MYTLGGASGLFNSNGAQGSLDFNGGFRPVVVVY